MTKTCVLRLVSLLSAAAFVLTAFPATAAAESTSAGTECTGIRVTWEKAESYADYRKPYKELPPISASVLLEGAAFSEADENTRTETGYAGVTDAVAITSENGYATWSFTVKEAGLYAVALEYCSAGGKGSAMVRSLYIDGSLPFDEARNLSFSRVWADQVTDGAFETDLDGNDIRPMQGEQVQWMSTYLYASSGLVVDPLQIYLSVGTHTLTLAAVQEPMAIRRIMLGQYTPPPSSEELRRRYDDEGYTAPAAKTIRLQAEHPSAKSESVIMPVSDRSTPAVVPNDPARYKLNTLGGVGWNSYGSWVSYTFTVKESGLYQIGIKTKQNFTVGSSAYRKVLINGREVCREMQAVEFPYSRSWQMSVLSDGQGTMPFYLEKGTCTLTLQNTLGDMTAVFLEATEILQELNDIYTGILVLTGTTPDVNRDYQFRETIPDTLAQMQTVCDRLEALYRTLVGRADTAGQNTQMIVQLKTQLRAMVENPNRIAEKFSSFSGYIEGFGSWIDDGKTQNLAMDYIEIAPYGAALPPVSADPGAYLSYHIRAFIASFVVDYNRMSYGESGQENITVWVGSGNTGGRDQAQIIKTMIGDSFTPESDIGVTVKLVSMGALLPATLAGIGPDVALSLGPGEAANYAFRNALLDLSGMEGFEEVRSRFSDSAMTPLTFGDTVYGIPETESFLMLFYRKDILLDLGITQVPRTWDEVKALLPVLHKSNMEFALPSASASAVTMYALLLFQRGGALYSENGAETLADSDASVDAFTELTKLYTDYKLSEELNFLNRFRQGTAPIGISDYTLYNSLSVFAPELKGLWGFAPVPGTADETGSVDNTTVNAVSASVILKTTTHPEAAWAFVRWWTDADAQVLFGRQLESIMGTAARYATANREAFDLMPWTDGESRMLKAQWQNAAGIPEVPGSYFLPRYINFAFRDVVHSGRIPGDELIEAAKNINSEILQKRTEFGLPTVQEKGVYR